MSGHPITRTALDSAAVVAACRAAQAVIRADREEMRRRVVHRTIAAERLRTGETVTTQAAVAVLRAAALVDGVHDPRRDELWRIEHELFAPEHDRLERIARRAAAAGPTVVIDADDFGLFAMHWAPALAIAA
jgi:hypothetical protein